MKLSQHIWVFAFIAIGFTACQKGEHSFNYDYGAKNDSAVYYFNKGWVAIMDEGRWIDAEKSYRKAVAVDQDFLLDGRRAGQNDPIHLMVEHLLDDAVRIRLFSTFRQGKDQRVIPFVL